MTQVTENKKQSWNAEKDLHLYELWSHRDQLTKQEWEELYAIIYSTLRHGYTDLVNTIKGENHDDLLNDFFVDKVIKTAANPSSYNSAKGTFISYLSKTYENYLKDRLRYNARKSDREISPPYQSDNDEEWLDKKAATTFSPYSALSIPDVADALWEHGLDIDKVAHSATQWLDAQELWVRILLTKGWCSDKGQRVALKTLADRYEIASYHYKAQKLGITFKGQTPEKFSKTLLGRWLTGLGLSLEPDSYSALDAALKILCWAALNKVEPQKPGKQT